MFNNKKIDDEMAKYINMKEDQEMFDKCIENMKMTKNKLNKSIQNNQS